MRTAYILLRFPIPTETFVFQEVMDLRRLGLPVEVFTLYGAKARYLSAEMRAAFDGVHRMGWHAVPDVTDAIGYWRRRRPVVVQELLGAMSRQRWWEPRKSAENVLALLASFELARRFEHEGIEHIHAPWASGCATAAWAASKLTGKPFSFTARAWDIHPPDAMIDRKARDAVLVRAETAAAGRDLSTVVGELSGKLHVTYNGLPLRAERESAVSMRPPLRLLAMGRFVRKKGFDQLLRAAKLLADADIDFRLTVAGDGMLRSPLKRLAARLGITGRVRFPGFIPHDAVARLFLDSDIFVVPSVIAPSGDRDGLPTVILEALAHRVPVVATAVAGIPELIEDGVTGLLVRERDPAALATAIRRLLADRDAALAMAERGRARVGERFDPDRNHRAVLELYRRIERQTPRDVSGMGVRDRAGGA